MGSSVIATDLLVTVSLIINAGVQITKCNLLEHLSTIKYWENKCFAV